MRALLLAAILLSGCTGAPAPEDGPSKRFEDRFNIVSRGSHEVNFEMEEGASVRVVFNATYDVSCDLHSHNGTRVNTWQEGSGREATIDFVAPAAGTYSVWIRSTSEITTTVHYRMDGAFVLVE